MNRFIAKMILPIMVGVICTIPPAVTMVGSLVDADRLMTTPLIVATGALLLQTILYGAIRLRSAEEARISGQ